jgi:type I restriction enzyme S subunit
MNETLEAMARALFKSWFVDFDPVRAKAESRDTGLPKPLAALFPDRFKDSELGEVPAGWEVKTIGDLAEVVGGSTPRTSEAAYWDAGVHYWATPKDLSALTVPVLLETERRSLTLASHRSARDSCLLGQSSFRRVLRSVTGLSPKCPSRSIRASSP